MIFDPTATDSGQQAGEKPAAPADFVDLWTRVEIARAMREARNSLACLAEGRLERDQAPPAEAD